MSPLFKPPPDTHTLRRTPLGVGRTVAEKVLTLWTTPAEWMYCVGEREAQFLHRLFQVGSETPSTLSVCSPGSQSLASPKPQVSTPRCPPSAILQASTHLKTFEHLIYQVLDLVLTELHPHDLLQVCLHEGHHQVAARHKGLVNGPKSHPAPGLSSEEG